MADVIINKKFGVNWRDILNGLIMAVLTPVFVLLQNSLAAGVFTINWENLGMAAVAGAVGYILKNLLSPTTVVLKGEEAQKVIEEKQNPVGESNT